jgi:O-antigen ligase
VSIEAYRYKIFSFSILLSLLLYALTISLSQGSTYTDLWGDLASSDGLVIKVFLSIFLWTIAVALPVENLIKIFCRSILAISLILAIFQFSNLSQVINFFGNTNFASFFVALAAIVASMEYFESQRKRTARNTYILFSLGLCALLYSIGDAQGVVLYIFGVLLFLALLHAWGKKSFYICFFAMSTLSAIVVIVLGGITKFFPSLVFTTLQIRLMYWETAIKMIEDNFLLGVGITRFDEEFIAYSTPETLLALDGLPPPESAHNLILHTMATTGALGSVSVLFPFALAIIALLRSPKLTFEECKIYALLLTAFVGLCFTVSNIVCMVIFTFLLGIVLQRYIRVGLAKSYRRKSKSLRRIVLALAAVVYSVSFVVATNIDRSLNKVQLVPIDLTSEIELRNRIEYLLSLSENKLVLESEAKVLASYIETTKLLLARLPE